MRTWNQIVRRTTGLVGVAILSAGCSVVPVQAWEKGHLAQRSMALEGHAQEAGLAEHIYASREGASGRAGVGASGCGCN
ncbi:DUF4266 domain-containing protein [Inhella gelatinilytica]|uniref:DUF4266 domain-containing protein n=1 Tax=Inhella gelatinilytica TaxID=2795030 RepID=A0A931IZK3_9BURK|nr:DUF4266 domain-containing protein [Inhella gelatinilytica]MBH9552691.1 DUF4266 domain-containing protein [Inhella gelatinilytica]